MERKRGEKERVRPSEGERSNEEWDLMKSGTTSSIPSKTICLCMRYRLFKARLGEAINILSLWDSSDSCASPGPHPERSFRRFRGLEPMIFLRISYAWAAALDHIASSVRSSHVQGSLYLLFVAKPWRQQQAKLIRVWPNLPVLHSLSRCPCVS